MSAQTQHGPIFMLSDRLLAGMHKVLSHDLPNQLVAVQGLLQLLTADESEHLTTDGREYVRRLRNATGRAAEMVRFLREMDRLQSLEIRVEVVTLSALMREFQGELQRRHPMVWLEYSWQWDVPSIRCDPRVMLQALHEMFEAMLDPEAERCDVAGLSRLKGDRIELTFSLSAPRKKLGPEPRMEFILAGEWLALLGAEVERATPDDPARFTILAPVH